MRFIFVVMGKGRGLLFASPLRRKTGHRNQENFCTAYAGRNGFHLKRAVGTQIEVSPICGVAACTESAFLPLCCSGVVRLARVLRGVMARYPDPEGLCGFQGSGMKNCR